MLCYSNGRHYDIQRRNARLKIVSCSLFMTTDLYPSASIASSVARDNPSRIVVFLILNESLYICMRTRST